MKWFWTTDEERDKVYSEIDEELSKTELREPRLGLIFLAIYVLFVIGILTYAAYRLL